MTGRAVRAGAAAAALTLAALQVRTWRAESHYERGIHAPDPRTGREVTDQPARDVPGRLEAYEAAFAEDPSQPLYGLRAGQILLQRAGRRPPPPDREALVRRAAVLLRAAVQANPLEGRAHDGLATVAAESGDLDGAVAATRRSVATAPRRPATLRQAAQRLVWAWRRTFDPDLLASAIDVARLGYELRDGGDDELAPFRTAPGADTVAEFLAGPGAPGIDDVRLALRGREDLRGVAVRLLGRSRPADAEALRAEAGP